MSEQIIIEDGPLLTKAALSAVAAALGIPAATLAGLREKRLVAVPVGDLKMIALGITTSIARLTEVGEAMVAQEDRLTRLAAAQEAARDA